MSVSRTKAILGLEDDRPLCPQCTENKLYAFHLAVDLGGYLRQGYGTAWVAVCKTEGGAGPGCGFSVRLADRVTDR